MSFLACNDKYGTTGGLAAAIVLFSIMFCIFTVKCFLDARLNTILCRQILVWEIPFSVILEGKIRIFSAPSDPTLEFC